MPAPRLAFAACLLLVSAPLRAQEAEEPTPEPERAQPPAAKGAPSAPSQPEPKRKAAPPAPAAAPAAPRVVRLPTSSPGDLEREWERWRKAFAAKNPREAEAALQAVAHLAAELGFSALDGHAVALIRAADARRSENDPAQAVLHASYAAQLSPKLPAAHLALATAYLSADLTEPGRAVAELLSAASLVVSQPRHLRPLLSDLGAASLLGLVGTALAVALALLIRRGRYFLHDFHHLFPRATARWQSGALAVLVLLVAPVVLRLGLGPLLVGVALALSLYLTWRERVVLGLVLAALGAVPWAGGLLARQTAFFGTSAEVLTALNEGRPGADALAAAVRARAGEDQASYLELFAAGRLELVRGRPDEALLLLKRAAEKKSNDAALLTNLGNAMLARGDSEGAVALYEEAAKADARSAAPHFNLGRVHQRRASLVIQDARPLEVAKASGEMVEAIRLDPSLSNRREPPEGEVLLAELVVIPALPEGELLPLAADDERMAKVAAQLSQSILGDFDPKLAPFYPLLAALGVGLLGLLAGPLKASRPCDRCGRSVCRRCDPELGPVSQMCHQCVNVFARRGVVPAPLKVRKQIEVAHHKTRSERLAYALGALCSGAGHLFSGAPVRGALYAFAFLFGVALAVLRRGVLRPVYGELPLAYRLVPVALLVLCVYALSLRGLFKRQSA